MISARCLYDIAIKIENAGFFFYEKAASLTQNKAMKPLFMELAKEEQNHKKAFEDKKEGLEIEDLSFHLTDKFLETIKATEKIFDPSRIEQTLNTITSAEDLLNLAIRQEEASIAYFSEIKGLTRGKSRKIIEAILNEERSHVSKLIAIRTNLRNLYRDKKRKSLAIP